MANTIIFKPALEKFLKKKRAKRAFIENAKACQGITTIEFLKDVDYTNKLMGSGCFLSSFIFAEAAYPLNMNAEDKHKYWWALSVEFDKIDKEA